MINILDELKDFPLQSRFQEVVFRGLYLRTAADVDMILTMIIVECFGYNSDEIKSYYSFANGKPKDVQNLTMSQKIEICKKGLQKYYPDFYLTLENDFKVFDKLRDYRNKFAHEKMEFFENDKNTVNVKSSKAVGEPPLLLGISTWTAVKHALSFVSDEKRINLDAPATNEEIVMTIAELESESTEKNDAKVL